MHFAQNAAPEYNIVPAVANIVCGSESGHPENVIDRTDLRLSLIRLIHTLCIARGLCYLLRHTLESPPKPLTLTIDSSSTLTLSG